MQNLNLREELMSFEDSFPNWEKHYQARIAAMQRWLEGKINFAQFQDQAEWRWCGDNKELAILLARILFTGRLRMWPRPIDVIVGKDKFDHAGEKRIMQLIEKGEIPNLSELRIAVADLAYSFNCFVELCQQQQREAKKKRMFRYYYRPAPARSTRSRNS